MYKSIINVMFSWKDLTTVNNSSSSVNLSLSCLGEVLGWFGFLSLVSSLTTSLCKWVIKVRLAFWDVFRKLKSLQLNSSAFLTTHSHDEDYKQGYYDS